MSTEVQSDVQSRLQGLLQYPREDLAVELKTWLDIWTKDDNTAKENQADIAQAVLALANHGGGYILIGFKEADGAWQPDEKRPETLKGYSQDTLNAIVQRFAEPSFHCQMHHVSHPATGEVFPVIVVPGGHKVPIRSKAQGCNMKHVQMNCYYIRRPGPKSEQIQTSQEWDELIGRCLRMAREELLEDFRTLLYGLNSTPINADEEQRKEFEQWVGRAEQRFSSLRDSLKAEENPDRYEHGIWSFAYKIIGPVRSISRAEFRDILNKVDAHLTGWPVWTIFNRPELAPQPVEDVIECWLKDLREPDPSASDFWWASPKGMMYLLRGYAEDSPQITRYYNVHPGIIFDPVTPIWRIGECVLHAGRLADALTEASAQKILMRATWSGLSGRTMHSYSTPMRFFLPAKGSVETVLSEAQATPEQIGSNLSEVVATLLQPLYDTFGFFQMPIEVIQQELTKMRNRQY